MLITYRRPLRRTILQSAGDFSLFTLHFSLLVLAFLVSVIVLILTAGTLDYSVRIREYVANCRNFLEAAEVRRELFELSVVDEPDVATIVAADVSVERILTLILWKACVLVAPLIEVCSSVP